MRRMNWMLQHSSHSMFPVYVCGSSSSSSSSRSPLLTSIGSAFSAAPLGHDPCDQVQLNHVLQQFLAMLVIAPYRLLGCGPRFAEGGLTARLAWSRSLPLATCLVPLVRDVSGLFKAVYILEAMLMARRTFCQLERTAATAI
jgi:hypothetical protein